MNMLLEYIQNKYHYSNYQIAQLRFLFKTIFSELSKIIIMTILFHKHLDLYFFALIIMLFLRCTTGGLHFYTYRGCLAMSIIYLGIPIYVLSYLPVSHLCGIILLLLSLSVCFFIGPVTSKYRPKQSPEQFCRNRNITCIVILAYSLSWYIIPDKRLLTVGFWIIILHALQLIAARITRKETT